MRSFKITLAYDGGAYSGWQLQEDQPTVQQAIEEGLESVTGQQVRVTASGRTDAGVHAAGQVISCAIDTDLPAGDLGRALHANTPHDIYVLKSEEAVKDFHAIRDASSKQYRYLLQDATHHDVQARKYSWQLHHLLTLETMQEGAALLKGTHDFAAFQTSGSPRNGTVRTVSELSVERMDGDGFERILIHVSADGFLYNMVRNIVGSLVEVGRAACTLDWLNEALKSRDRRRAGPTAPAHGLTLMKVTYSRDLPPDPSAAGTSS